MVGFPSVGKSTLLTMLTGTESEAAAYEFTTLTCIPGVIHYNGSKIQLLDLPGIIEGAAQGKGRGREVIACAKSADLILMVLDAGKPWSHYQILTLELESMGIRLNRPPPAIYFKKKKSGGCMVNSQVRLTNMTEKTILRVLHEYKIHHCELLFRDDCTVDDLIDVIEGNRRYIKCIFTFNKIDVLSIEEVDEIARRELSVPISCYSKLNLDGLLERMWEEMDLVRVYTKKVGCKPDFGDPVVLSTDRGGVTVEAFCQHVHRDLVKDFSYALVWGRSTKHLPQLVGLSHPLMDEDVVQIVKSKVCNMGEAKGKFADKSKEPLKISDRVKKPKLRS